MTDSLIGKQLSNYRVERIVGRGGMATVYYGWDVSLERPVAIKVVDYRYRTNPAYTQRFVQEARTVATWRHNNIVQVFHASQEDDLSYFVMEYVDGPDLGQVMHQYASDGELMPQEDVLRLGRAIASALDYAHERQVIHRDVKPSNVMVAKDDRIVLTDFGLALNTQQGSIGEIFGTPHYIAPEQARNSATAVAQSDLYALGVILYEMLTGVVPFDDPSPTSLAVQHITQPPPAPRGINPRLNEATETVLLKALEKQPADRYQTGQELMATLAEALGKPATAVTDSDLPPLPTGTAAPALSQVSVAERVSFFLPPPPAQPAASPVPSDDMPPPPATAQKTNTQSPPPVVAPVVADKKTPWGLIGGGVVIVLLILFFGGRSLFGGEESATPPAPTATTEVQSALPTTISEAIPTAVETTQVTQPPEPTSETLPTATAVAPATIESATAEPAAIEPTAEIPPTEAIEPTPDTQPEAIPTILYPNGRRIEMHYNSSSFYIFNASPDRVRVSSIIFEALNSNGQPAGYSFDGYRWSQFYSFASSNGCARLEVLKMSDYLRPAKCREYNSTITPPENDPEHFWIERPDVTQYRVLWEGQEIARCPIPGDFCEAYLP